MVDTDQDAVGISEAAERLGISVEAIRQRIRRKKLEAYKVQDGTWRIVLASPTAHPNGVQDSVQVTVQAPVGPSDGQKELVAQLKGEVVFMRDEMVKQREQWAEESRRKDVIIAELTQQLKALPAKVKEEVEATPPPPAAPQRSWWQRLWGLQ